MKCRHCGSENIKEKQLFKDLIEFVCAECGNIIEIRTVTNKEGERKWDT